MFRVADPADKGKGGIQISQLAESDDPEVRRYLELAKSCANIRKVYESKW